MSLSLLKVCARLSFIALVAISCTKSNTQPGSNATPVFELLENTLVESNIIYKESGTQKLMLDVYTPAENLGEEPWIKRSDEPKPTLIYFHGGGWASGDRISRALYVLPYVQKGWAVVNADYRLLGQTNLPGCIEDCLNVVDWTFKNAGTYGFDTTRVVVSGESAGGHLALMAGMLMPRMKGAIKPHQLAAIVNWYGVSDLHTAVAYWKAPEYIDIVTKDFETNPDLLYTNSSPVNNISPATPPVISIHGDQDRNHPFSQSKQLHEALNKSNIPNRLVNIAGKKHGNFTSKELEYSFNEIWKFLDEHVNTPH